MEDCEWCYENVITQTTSGNIHSDYSCKIEEELSLYLRCKYHIMDVDNISLVDQVLLQERIWWEYYPDRQILVDLGKEVLVFCKPEIEYVFENGLVHKDYCFGGRVIKVNTSFKYARDY